MGRIAMPARRRDDLPCGVDARSDDQSLVDGIAQGDVDTAAADVPYRRETGHEGRLCIDSRLKGGVRVAHRKTLQLGVGAGLVFKVNVRIDKPG